MNKPVVPTYSMDQSNIKHDLKYYREQTERGRKDYSSHLHSETSFQNLHV
jgi:hypothetical protein